MPVFTMRRLAAALVGMPLLLATTFEAYVGSFGFYNEHYLMPKEKYGVLTPLRWQDIVFLVLFWCVELAAFYCSYRLLRYSVQSRPSSSQP